MSTSTLLKAENLSFRVAEKQLLNPLHLEIKAGTVTVLVGPNGAGKSTLLKLLAGVLKPSTGQVRLSEKPLADWSAQERARHLAVMNPREPLPSFPLTLREYVSLGRSPYQDWLGRMRPQDLECLGSALQDCGLVRFQNRDIRSLSSGEWQKVQLARALAQAPQVLLLDEPTSHLDIQAEVEVMHLLRTLSQTGLGIFVILHDLNLAAHFSDQLLLLHQGQLEAQGPANTVLRPEVLERIYGPYWEVEPGKAGKPLLRPHYEGQESASWRKEL